MMTKKMSVKIALVLLTLCFAFTMIVFPVSALAVTTTVCVIGLAAISGIMSTLIARDMSEVASSADWEGWWRSDYNSIVKIENGKYVFNDEYNFSSENHEVIAQAICESLNSADTEGIQVVYQGNTAVLSYADYKRCMEIGMEQSLRIVPDDVSFEFPSLQKLLFCDLIGGIGKLFIDDSGNRYIAVGSDTLDVLGGKYPVFSLGTFNYSNIGQYLPPADGTSSSLTFVPFFFDGDDLCIYHPQTYGVLSKPSVSLIDPWKYGVLIQRNLGRGMNLHSYDIALNGLFSSIDSTSPSYDSSLSFSITQTANSLVLTHKGNTAQLGSSFINTSTNTFVSAASSNVRVLVMQNQNELYNFLNAIWQVYSQGIKVDEGTQAIPIPKPKQEEIIDKAIEKGIVIPMPPIALPVDGVGTLTVDGINIDKLEELVELGEAELDETKKDLEYPESEMLIDKFPFSLPFDLIRVFTILIYPEKEPIFEIPIKAQFGSGDIDVDIDEKLVLDLTQYRVGKSETSWGHDIVQILTQSMFNIFWVLFLIRITPKITP